MAPSRDLLLVRAVAMWVAVEERGSHHTKQPTKAPCCRANDGRASLASDLTQPMSESCLFSASRFSVQHQPKVMRAKCWMVCPASAWKEQLAPISAQHQHGECSTLGGTGGSAPELDVLEVQHEHVDRSSGRLLLYYDPTPPSKNVNYTYGYTRTVQHARTAWKHLRTTS